MRNLFQGQSSNGLREELIYKPPTMDGIGTLRTEVGMPVGSETEMSIGRETEMSVGREAKISVGRETEISVGRETEISLGSGTEISVGREVSAGRETEISVGSETETAVGSETARIEISVGRARMGESTEEIEGRPWEMLSTMGGSSTWMKEATLEATGNGKPVGSPILGRPVARTPGRTLEKSLGRILGRAMGRPLRRSVGKTLGRVMLGTLGMGRVMSTNPERVVRSMGRTVTVLLRTLERVSEI